MHTRLHAHLQFFTSLPVLGFLILLTLVLGLYGSGSFSLALFYGVLVLWSVLVSGRLVLLPLLAPVPKESPALLMNVVESKRPDLFVSEVTVGLPMVEPAAVSPRADAPSNLPIVGYANFFEAAVTEVKQADEDERARQLEGQAHAARALLSTDALRYFLATVPDKNTAQTVLDEVLKNAKAHYPNEDGWVVVSEERMRELCVVCLAGGVPTSSEAPFVPTIVPEGTGSLAEMIVEGNVGAAFALIGHRPMFALADAVADLDALYRGRRGKESSVSTLLMESSAHPSDDQVKAVISALTSALDGMYTSEAEAVKTAIMKAVKVAG